MSGQLAAQSNHSSNDPSNVDLTTAELFDLFSDSYTRQVYLAVMEEPRCARDVAEAADVSRPTVYRRLNELRDAGLVHSRQTICMDGHHREQFEAVPATISVCIDTDGLETVVDSAESCNRVSSS